MKTYALKLSSSRLAKALAPFSQDQILLAEVEIQGLIQSRKWAPLPDPNRPWRLDTERLGLSPSLWGLNTGKPVWGPFSPLPHVGDFFREHLAMQYGQVIVSRDVATDPRLPWFLRHPHKRAPQHIALLHPFFLAKWCRNSDIRRNHTTGLYEIWVSPQAEPEPEPQKSPSQSSGEKYGNDDLRSPAEAGVEKHAIDPIRYVPNFIRLGNALEGRVHRRAVKSLLKELANVNTPSYKRELYAQNGRLGRKKVRRSPIAAAWIGYFRANERVHPAFRLEDAAIAEGMNALFPRSSYRGQTFTFEHVRKIRSRFNQGTLALQMKDGKKRPPKKQSHRYLRVDKMLYVMSKSGMPLYRIITKKLIPALPDPWALQRVKGRLETPIPIGLYKRGQALAEALGELEPMELLYA